jgi:aerobic-type carbon monoxide dehydrogenase small subunit (CoxS/CutS family)
VRISCKINGADFVGDVEPRILLSDFLRHHAKLTGTHVGCEIGVCGACTVVMNGDPIRSCLTFAVQADGQEIGTVEGLSSKDGSLSSLQECFGRYHALQCGFCTPGILMTLAAERARGRWPKDETEARELISGNICRCTGYQSIVDAILGFAP